MPQGANHPTGHTLDVAFTLRGDRIPVDHGYALYSALAHLAPAGPWLHKTDNIAIHRIRGTYVGGGLLRLNLHSRLTLRLPADTLPNILSLAGQTLKVEGHRLHVGIPQPSLPTPAVALFAHTVTTRNGQDEARFDTEIQRQLDSLGIQGKATRGRRRAMKIKDKTVIGHSLLVTELTAEESIRLQEVGLGGRRKMGCGVFVPWRG